jgi:hypothetical protein
VTPPGHHEADFIAARYFWTLGHHYSDSRRFAPGAVRAGQVVYARVFSAFLQSQHPRIDAPYVLLSTYYDRTVTRDVEGALESPTLLRWFAVNVTLPHPKIQPLPLGLRFYQPELLAARGRPKTTWLYMNFSRRTRERIRLWSMFCDQPFCRAVPHDKHHYRDYAEGLAEARFTLSPAGEGPDCYRTWEALCVGTVPIVRRGLLDDRLYDGLPVMLVDDWTEVTMARMSDFWQGISPEAFRHPRLTNGYWRQRIQGAA